MNAKITLEIYAEFDAFRSKVLKKFVDSNSRRSSNFPVNCRIFEKLDIEGNAVENLKETEGIFPNSVIFFFGVLENHLPCSSTERVSLTRLLYQL